MGSGLDRLLAQPCAPCRPGTPPLTAAAAASLLAELGHGWTIADGRLRRALVFPDFASALAYVDRVGAMSDAVDHHPDVELGWGRVALAIWSHSVGGLTATDFSWAARAEALVAPASP